MPQVRRRRRNVVKKLTSLKNQHARLVHEIARGIIYTPSNDPPRIVMAPWNNLVCQFSVENALSTAAKVCVGVSDIVSRIFEQFSVPVASDLANMMLRFRKVSAWDSALVESSTNIVRMSVYPLISISTTCAGRPLVDLTDVGTPVKPAKAGYQWPDTHFAVAISAAASATTKILQFRMAEKQRILVHLHLLWNLADTSATADDDEVLTLTQLKSLSMNEKGTNRHDSTFDEHDSFSDLND